MEGFLSPLGGGPRPEVPVEPREFLDPPVSLEPPVSGPPAAWVREHGFTAGCRACANLQAGKRASGSHNAACSRRYREWLRETVAPEGVGIHMHGQPSSSQTETVDVSENRGESHVAVGRPDVPDSVVGPGLSENSEASRGQPEVPMHLAAPSNHASSSHAGVEAGTGREVRTEEPRQSLLKRPFPSSSSPSELPSPGSVSTPAQGVKRSADVELVDLEDLEREIDRTDRAVGASCWRVCTGAQMLVHACPMVVLCHAQISLMRL